MITISFLKIFVCILYQHSAESGSNVELALEAHHMARHGIGWIHLVDMQARRGRIPAHVGSDTRQISVKGSVLFLALHCENCASSDQFLLLL